MTLSEIRAIIERDLDLEEEQGITRAEINAAINSAIRKAEAEIHSLYEDYFFAKAYVAMVSGTSSYDLPSDIYANKIRGLYYKDGTEEYEVKPIVRSYEMIDPDQLASYKYKLINTSASGIKLTLFPSSRITSSTALTLFYIRNAKQLVNDSDTCDIPEFEDFIIADTKVRLYVKDGDPRTQEAIAEREDCKARMVTTLSRAIPDENNKLDIDMSFYEEIN